MLNKLWKQAVEDTVGMEAIKTRQRFMELTQCKGYSIRELFNYMLIVVDNDSEMCYNKQ